MCDQIQPHETGSSPVLEAWLGVEGKEASWASRSALLFLPEVQAGGRCSDLPAGANHRARAAGTRALRGGVGRGCNKAQEGATGQAPHAAGGTD